MLLLPQYSVTSETYCCSHLINSLETGYTPRRPLFPFSVCRRVFKGSFNLAWTSFIFCWHLIIEALSILVHFKQCTCEMEVSTFHFRLWSCFNKTGGSELDWIKSPIPEGMNCGRQVLAVYEPEVRVRLESNQAVVLKNVFK